jgi:hypothetical protein
VLTLVAGLSTGHKVGLAVVAGVFIVFALTTSMLIPSRWPDFPTGAGLRPFLVATVALFIGMMLAVFFLAREPKETTKEPRAAGAGTSLALRAANYELTARATRTGPYHTREPFDRTAWIQ